MMVRFDLIASEIFKEYKYSNLKTNIQQNGNYKKKIPSTTMFIIPCLGV